MEKHCTYYHAFGMMMPGRAFSTPTYRYGYQGSEKDLDMIGEPTHYSTFFRELDTRISQWWSPDPKAGFTPWESPYISMGRNPILYTDPMGDIRGKHQARREAKRINENGGLAAETKDANKSWKVNVYSHGEREYVSVQTVWKYEQKLKRKLLDGDLMVRLGGFSHLTDFGQNNIEAIKPFAEKYLQTYEKEKNSNFFDLFFDADRLYKASNDNVYLAEYYHKFYLSESE